MKYRYTCSVFVIQNQKLLMIKHKKLKRWLPPGGVIEDTERPDEAAIREVLEELNLKIKLIGNTNNEIPDVKIVHQPIHIQVENNPYGKDNIDFIYYAEPEESNFQIRINIDEVSDYLWFDREMIKDIPEEEIRVNAFKALDYL